MSSRDRNLGVDRKRTAHCGSLIAAVIGLLRTPHSIWVRRGIWFWRNLWLRLTLFNRITLSEIDCAAMTPNMTPKIITRDTLPDLGKGQGHKYDHGHALVLSGPPGHGGAARLAARGALRVGAGLVTILCPLRAVFEHSTQPNAIMIRGIDGPTGFVEILEDVRVSSVCLGPGLGLTQITAEMVRVALKSEKAAVLDADALSRFERAPDTLFQQLHTRTVITPHEGEFRRLFPDIAETLTSAADEGATESKIAAAHAAAERAGCIVLLKGEITVIAHPDGRCAVHMATQDRAAPWLATAGSGDVLSGFIVGLMARGVPPMEAAEAGAWLHVECARRFGPSLIADDLPDQLPGVLSDVLA
ncbi:MAG: NAD(P)H-hydrate dehydratase [Paracoccaceae bacterium]